MDFISLKEKFDEFERRYNNGEVDYDTYVSEAQKYFIQDEQGRSWTIQIGTGDWLVYENDQWIKKDPPIQSQNNIENNIQNNEKTNEDVDVHIGTKLKFGVNNIIGICACLLYVISFFIMSAIIGFSIVEFIIMLGVLICLAIIIISIFTQKFVKYNLIFKIVYFLIAIAIAGRVLIRFLENLAVFASLIMFLSVLGLAYTGVLKLLKK